MLRGSYCPSFSRSGTKADWCRIDCFLAHSRLFFEMSIPRFRYRLTFTDRRRPSLALLNAMVGFTVKSSLTKQYLWATRISNSPQMSSMEQTFFTAACRHLDISSANGDRLMDCLRAAMLLSAYSYTSGRFHEVRVMLVAFPWLTM